MRRAIAGLILFASTAALLAGSYNEVLKLGDPAPVWQNLPGVDGKTHSLDDLKAKDVVVLVFTCNSCPAAEEYEDRIIALSKKHAANVVVVAINVNTIPEDRMPEGARHGLRGSDDCRSKGNRSSLMGSTVATKVSQIDNKVLGKIVLDRVCVAERSCGRFLADTSQLPQFPKGARDGSVQGQ